MEKNRWEQEMATLLGTAMDGRNVSVLIGETELNLVCAYSQKRKTDGLRAFSEMPQDGMIFVYSEPSSKAFDTSRMAFPVVVHWFDQQGKQLASVESDNGEVRCVSPYNYVIESSARYTGDLMGLTIPD